MTVERRTCQSQPRLQCLHPHRHTGLAQQSGKPEDELVYCHARRRDQVQSKHHHRHRGFPSKRPETTNSQPQYQTPKLACHLPWPFNPLTPSRPLLPYGTAIKHPVADRVKPSFVIFDIRAL